MVQRRVHQRQRSHQKVEYHVSVVHLTASVISVRCMLAIVFISLSLCTAVVHETVHRLHYFDSNSYNITPQEARKILLIHHNVYIILHSRRHAKYY